MYVCMYIVIDRYKLMICLRRMPNSDGQWTSLPVGQDNLITVAFISYIFAAKILQNGQEQNGLRKADMGMLEMKLSCFVWTFRRNLLNKFACQKFMKIK